MKRRGYVIEEICEMDNLRLAYWKAKRGKSAKQEVVRYTQDLQTHLLELWELLSQGKIPPIDYHYFTVFDPKKRQICATVFHQRVLQHALMNICYADFERYQTDDSYASRIGRGTYAALGKAIDNQKRYRYCLKLDVRKYFDSVRHDVSLTSTEQMCTFLEYRISRTRQCLSPRSIARYEQKVRDLYWQYNQNMLTQKDMNSHLLPLVGFTMHVASGFQRANVMARL